MLVISAEACSAVTPGLSRAMTAMKLMPRSLRGLTGNSVLTGIHSS